MSLIIVKTNKNKNTHSIFCDGLSCSGNEIITKNARKIANTNKDGYNILIGCVGTSSLGRHIRINFSKYFDINEFNYSFGDDRLDYLVLVFQDLYDSFYKRFNIEKSRENYENISADVILSICGEIYVIRQRDGGIIDIELQDNCDYYAIGTGQTESLCLLDAGVDIDKVFEIVSGRYTSVNNTISCFSDIGYKSDD